MPTLETKHQLEDRLCYHIIHRGNNRLSIFKRSEDAHMFKDHLLHYCLKFKCEIYHWAIMSNHYHLLCSFKKPENISRFMAGLSTKYAKYYHKTHQTSGYVWQVRYRAQAVEKDQYLLSCARYIERNPIRAGLVLRSHEYHLCSSPFYIKGSQDFLTTVNPLLRDPIQHSEYIRFIYQDDPDEHLFASCKQRIAGSIFFRDHLVQYNGRPVARRRGRPRSR